MIIVLIINRRYHKQKKTLHQQIKQINPQINWTVSQPILLFGVNKIFDQKHKLTINPSSNDFHWANKLINRSIKKHINHLKSNQLINDLPLFLIWPGIETVRTNIFTEPSTQYIKMLINLNIQRHIFVGFF